jgi:hypothetical protein
MIGFILVIFILSLIGQYAGILSYVICNGFTGLSKTDIKTAILPWPIMLAVIRYKEYKKLPK